MTATPVQISQHAGKRVYLSIQASRADDAPVWREPLQALGCSVGSHPGRPPIVWYPRRLVTLFGLEGAKVDPGVGLECCSVGRWRPQGASGKRSSLGDSGGLWLLRGEPGGPRHGLEWLLHSRQRSGPPQARSQGPRVPSFPFRPTPRLGLPQRNFFLAFFFFSPSSPILGTATPPDVTAFLGEGHVVP